MFKRILLPVDSSDLSARAVRAGLELAGRCQASLHAFHVLEPPPPLLYAGPVVPVSDAEYEQAALRGQRVEAERLLAEVRSAAVAAGVICDVSYVLARRAYAAILHAAEQHCCDLIIMGSHGRSGLGAWLQGSASQQVASRAGVPVMIYH